MAIIDGKMISEQIQNEIKTVVDQITTRKPVLAVIIVGNHPPSQIYVNRKTQACETVGMISIKKELPATISESELLHEVQLLNCNPDVDGILVQLPLPHQINPTLITQSILPEKDVDGFHPVNVGKLFIGETDGFIPCTPLGVKVMLERSHIEVSGKHAVIIGRSNIVGKPMAALLMQSMPGGNATVTVVHRQTTNFIELCQMADLLIVAIGQPLFIKKEMVKEGVVVIDVGINKIVNPNTKSGYQIVGDVDFNQVKEKCSYISPVPGGVGPMTIAMLLHNTLISYQKRIQQSQS